MTRRSSHRGVYAAARGVEAPSSSDRDVRGAHPRLTWRVILDPPRPGARNMALDHALATSVSNGEAVLRLYGWTRPTASFGRNEPVKGRYSEEAALGLGIDFVRRPTGGRVVLHDEEVTYAVAAPARALGGSRAAYRRINQALAGALASLGAEVTVSDETIAPPSFALDAGPCFRSPVAGEVVALGRKLVGSAQARVEGALLQHGSIVLAGDQSRIEAMRVGRVPPEPADSPAPATVHELLGPVDRTMIIDAIVEAMHRTFGGEWIDGGFTDEELARADRLAADRYATSAWTWRM